MIPPVLLLRDSLLASLVLSGAGLMWGVDAGIAVAAGGAGACLNLWLMIRAAEGAARGGLGALLLPLKTMIALVIVGVLVTAFPVVPVLVGFSAGILGLLARGLLGAFIPSLSSPSRAPVES